MLRTEGPTPHGGAYSLTAYTDKYGNACAEVDATGGTVTECAADGSVIWTDYLRPRQPDA